MKAKDGLRHQVTNDVIQDKATLETKLAGLESDVKKALDAKLELQSSIDSLESQKKALEAELKQEKAKASESSEQKLEEAVAAEAVA